MAFFGRATKTGGDGKKKAGQYPGGGNNHQYDNHDGPVRPGGDPRGDTIDYGPSNGPSQQERIDAAWKKWGGSGLYVNGVEMPWAHGPNQERGKRAPFFTPDVLDPRNAGYFAGGTSPEQEAARMNARNSRYADTYSGNMQDSNFSSSADTLRQFGIDVSDPNVRLGELLYKNRDKPEIVAAINEHGRQMEIAKRGLSQDYRPPSRAGGPWPAPHAPPAGGARSTSTATPSPGAPSRTSGGADTPSSGRELNEWLRDHPETNWTASGSRTGGASGIMGYDPLPSKPTGMLAANGTKKPKVVRRGGGRVDSK